MPISFKAPASSALLNSTFLDKTQDDATIGKLDLNNSDSESGNPIINVQSRLNSVTPVVNATIVLGGGDQIALSESYYQYIRIVSDGGTVFLNSLPFSSQPLDGSIIYLVGTDDTNDVTIEFNDSQFGAYINGDATLKRGYVLTLAYDAVLERYLEISRNF